ncbi:MAG: serine/threonine-protein kinase [Lentisphaerae bacterium]|nr:serine/threonine-protein kinase [Lentisphaerota bacterium]
MGGILGDKDVLVGEMIGRGGMGDVYKAKQLSLHRDIAMKIIKWDTDGRNDARNSFLREAIVTGNLEHPNIVPVYDVAETSDGHLYYLMKEIKGDSWEKVLEEKSLDENLEILLDVCDAIAYAHSRHVIHRDLKPENVMLGEYCEVVVMDWGIAATTKQGEHSKPEEKGFRAEQLTAESDLAGTLDYMPPEMVEGDPGKIGLKSDIYLLGGILYRIVTGMPPHPTYANMLQTIAAVSANIIRPTDRKGELVDIALKALDTDPGNRFVSVKEFQDAIRGHRTHSESISLFEMALNDYRKALNSNSYEDFSEAVFGFRESLKLWPGNPKASEMIDKVLFSYAEKSYGRGDFDLSLSLLDPDIPEHAVLAEKVAVAKGHRLSRKIRIEMLTRISIFLVVALVGILSVSTSIV